MKEIGTVMKYERARGLRSKRHKAHKYSAAHQPHTGYRFLDERELHEWHSRLGRICERRATPMVTSLCCGARMPGNERFCPKCGWECRIRP